MAVGILRLTLYLPESRSLKDKRRVLRSVKDRLRGQFNVSVAEVDHLDLWQKATVAVALVSKDARHADRLLQKVLDRVESYRLADIIDVKTEIL
ncbi:MAG: DUF503 domain-containing protein [Deltaproteobacteria bacterium]|nr:DUF503 domain-containing protein [Deltaproteobacteria bacterium]